MKEKIKYYILLHIIILMYSIEGICSKTAAQYPVMSFKWCFFYCLMIGLLGVYAIAWQQILKHLPLVTSYANKSVTTIWGLLWGFVIFHEGITLQKVLGALIIIAGVYLVVTGEEDQTNA